MNKISVYSLDYYNKIVIKSIMEKYALDEMKAMQLFLNSETHKMLEDAELTMWEFSTKDIFEMWEVEQITGDPRNSKHLRSEV